MAVAYLTRAVHFSASHRYYRAAWTDQENARRFGASARPEGHGHNYRCEVTVVGPIDPETGMVIDLDELDRTLREVVTDRMHHRHLNTSVPEFGEEGAIPTTENLAAYILDEVTPRLPEGVKVYRVRVREDRDLWSDVYGAGPAT